MEFMKKQSNVVLYINFEFTGRQLIQNLQNDNFTAAR